CPICSKSIKHKALRSHMGGHILRAQMGIKEDHLIAQASSIATVDPCGFCGQSGHPVRLVKESKKHTFQPSSSCSLAITFSLGAAATSSKNSPSTNAPIRCSICPATSGDRAVVWKYNMPHHLGTVHAERSPTQPLPADLVNAMKVVRLEQERLGIPGEFISVGNEDEASETGEGTPATTAKRTKRASGAPSGQRQSKRAKASS
ncbi:hypothetical protein PAXINDRAFT_88831, partial [Paxillus involutus ATCC 200175]